MNWNELIWNFTLPKFLSNINSFTKLPRFGLFWYLNSFSRYPSVIMVRLYLKKIHYSTIPISKWIETLTTIKNRWEELNNMSDRNLFAIITSEHQIKVVALPNLVTVHKHTISEGTIARASIAVLNSKISNNQTQLSTVSLANSFPLALSYLTCCLTNGTFLVFNLPNLKLNIQLSLTPLSHDKNFAERILKTFTFGSKGHSFYMSSPSEMQKLYLSSSSNVFNLSDMLPELFDPKIVTPERPKTNIFKTIFSNTSQAQLDREELCKNSRMKSYNVVLSNWIKQTKWSFG